MNGPANTPEAFRARVAAAKARREARPGVIACVECGSEQGPFYDARICKPCADDARLA